MYQGRETKARLKKVKNDKKKAKRRQKVVAFSRCSCAQRVAGRLAGIELDGSSPGNRIFYLSRARTLPPSLHTHSLFVHSSFSIPLFLSLSLSSVPVLLSRSLCALTLSSISSSVIIALSLSLSLYLPRSHTEEPQKQHITSYTHRFHQRFLSFSLDLSTRHPLHTPGTRRRFSHIYTLADDFRQTAQRSPPSCFENTKIRSKLNFLISFFFFYVIIKK